MRFGRRSIGAVVGAVALIVSLAPGAFAASEDSLLAKLNSERSSRGLSALVSHWDLVDDAEAHSVRMMNQDNLHHNANLGGVTTGWAALGENVGVGPSVNSIHAAFMDSSGHRGNILGDFTHVGIGAVRESDNKLWVTVVFMKASGGSTTTTTSTTSTTAAPTTTGTPPPTGGPTTTATPPPITTTSTTPKATVTQATAAAGVDTPAALSGLQGRVVRLHQPRPV